MKKYIVMGLILLLLAACQTTPETTQEASPEAQPDITNGDVAPAEQLDEELDAQSLDTVGAALDDMTW